MLRVQNIRLIKIILSCSLVKLSMKNCDITDDFTQEVAPQLATNGNLLHLNMSCNSIGDTGCAALATSLRLNRTLLTLSLTGNSIGNGGAASLALVHWVKWFVGDHN